MKHPLACLLFAASAAVLSAVEYRLPFNGTWFVMQGGDSPNVNQHARVQAQLYGLDLMKVGGASGRELANGPGKAREDFFSWGEPVLSPVDGEVISAIATFPDNPIGTKDTKNVFGNHVVIKAANDRFVVLAHMQHESVKVKAGDGVKAGDVLGLCGNSGNTDAPHIHMHVQDTPTLNTGTGQNVRFHRLSVELSGMHVDATDWPLIRGLLVSPMETKAP